MKDKIKVAVVVLNWNGCKLLDQFLPALVRYTTSEEVELVLADNCSTDNSVAFTQAHYPQIRCILLPENEGYAGGYNEALKQVSAEYYVLLNSDVEVTSNWLLPMIDYLDAHTHIAAAQPKIVAQRKTTHFEYAGAAGGYIDKYGYPFCRGRIFSEVEVDNGQYNSIEPVFWASGACLVIRSMDYMDAGGLDASFFAHMEEIDLCWRLHARGREVVCIPQSVVYHVGGATLAEESADKTFLNFRNNLLMLYKNLPEHSLNKTLRIRLYLDYLAAGKYLLSGKASHARAVWEAHRAFRKLKKAYLKQRTNNQKLTTQDKIASIYPRSILVDFFVKGHRKYSQLHKNNPTS